MSGDRTFHVVEAVVEPGDVGGATLRRHWPEEFKERAVAAALEPGANVSAVARQMGISPAQLFGWRRKALAKGEASTAPAKSSSTEVVTSRSVPVVEIVIGDTVIRVGADIGEVALRRVLRAVRQS
jgi:transposase